MLDYKTLNLGDEYDFVTKTEEGYQKKTGKLNAIFINSDGYTSVQMTCDDVNHDIKLAQLTHDEDFIAAMEDADKFAEELQEELNQKQEELFKEAREKVKERFDVLFK